jgi:hypothetical protein
MNYGSGTAAGTIARDTVSMGPFTVNPQVFGARLSFPPPFCFLVSGSSVGSFVLFVMTAQARAPSHHPSW